MDGVSRKASPCRGVLVAGPLKVWLPTIRAGSGTDVFVERLAEGLARYGHDPIVQWFPHRYELMPWRLLGVQPPHGTAVVHAASWQAFAFKRPGLPLVATEHNYVLDPAFAPYRSFAQACYHRFFIAECLRRTYRDANVLVAVSHYTASAMRSKINREVVVIHNWVDSQLFRPQMASAPPVNTQPFKLLFVGNPARWKGTDLLPKLAIKLGDEFELYCLGGLRSRHNDVSEGTNIRYLNSVRTNEMPGLYQSMDAVVVLARHEAFGYVALEAMACGLPVVGFDTTGTREVCKNGESALLVKMDDLDAFTVCCKKLARNPALVSRMGEAGRDRAISLFGEKDGIDAYVRAYEKAIDSIRDKK